MSAPSASGELMALSSDLRIYPTFATISLDDLRGLIGAADGLSAAQRLAEFVSYFLIDCPAGVSTSEVISTASSLTGIDAVYLAPLAAEPPAQTSGIAQWLRDPNKRASHLLRIRERSGLAPGDVTGRRLEAAEERYERGIDRIKDRGGPLSDGRRTSAQLDSGYLTSIGLVSTTGEGEGVVIFDLEQGWSVGPTHDSVPSNRVTFVPSVAALDGELLESSNWFFQGHGDAVASLLVGQGAVTGIAPNAQLRLYSSRYRPQGSPDTPHQNLAGAILAATKEAMAAIADGKGAVMLIEAQSRVNGNGPYLPAEVAPDVFEAVRQAVVAGVVVIAAAGNGQTNLDSFTSPALATAMTGRRSPRPFAEGVQSGAILVGAGVRTKGGWRRASFSNFGSRVACFGPGTDISSAGDGRYRSDTAWYTNTFGGTSAASAIVAGAASVLLSRLLANGPNPPLAADNAIAAASVTADLTSIVGNTLSGRPSSDRIGVMPKLP